MGEYVELCKISKALERIATALEKANEPRPTVPMYAPPYNPLCPPWTPTAKGEFVKINGEHNG